MKRLCAFVCLLLVSHFAQGGTTLSPEQEAAYKQGLDRPAVRAIRDYIDDCLADKPKIGYPCEFTWDTVEGSRLRRQGFFSYKHLEPKRPKEDSYGGFWLKKKKKKQEKDNNVNR